MPSGSKLALTVGSLAVLLSLTVPATFPAAASAPSGSAQLTAHRAQLVAQLQTLSGPRGDARAKLIAAEQQLFTVQSQLQAARAHLASLDSSLLSLSRRIADDEHGLMAARAQLATLIRATYEATGRDGFAAAILSSDSFSQAMDRVRGAQHVTDQVRNLQGQVTGREASLLQEKASLQTDFAAAQAAEQQLQAASNRMLALVAQRDAAYQLLEGPARSLAAEIAQIDGELAGPPQSGSCGNHFAYGNCTYYVATRRCIPWFGNAYQWWNNAAAYGYLEGHAPERGAVAVWGQSGSSPVGHVAYVEAVGPDGGVPAGSFLVSEMNYDGWDRVDYRTVPDNAPGLIGFIYGHA